MDVQEAAISPREIIDRIRTHNFLLDIESASEMIKEGALNLQTQLNNALKLLSDDLYSKRSHFVLELVQNADDNHYESGVTPHLTLQVAQSRLVVINNENGFTEANVKAICSVGASSKAKQKSGYIGEKGIGFKSVFTVSDAPEIHSNGFHFKFDRSVDGNLLGYVVPHWCEAPPDVQGDCTTIILPASRDYAFGADTLVDLDARLLLFLNKLRSLTLEHAGRRITYRRVDQRGVSILTAEQEASVGEQSSQEMRYVRVSTLLPMEGSRDEKRPDIDQSAIVLAFPVDETGAAKPEATSHVFAFLPIRPMGFKFSIQADFILSSSREEILTDRPWNTFLRSGVASVFTSALDVFKETEALALSYLKYIPAEGEVADSFFRCVRADIIQQLAKTECLLSASGDWRKPSDLRLAEKSFRDLFPSQLALKLFGFDYVDKRVQGGSDLLKGLGAKDVSAQDVLNVFNVHRAWLQEQPLEWRGRFFAYVAINQQVLLAQGLLKCSCLPISDGSFAVPSQANVFFPLGRGKKYGFESELVFIDNELYEEAQKHSERVVALFSAMNVRSDDAYDLVNSHILPRHKGELWKTSNAKALVGHLRYVKDKLKSYFESALAHGKTEAQAYQLLRDGIWIGTKRQGDGPWIFDRVGHLYLSREYRPAFCLETHLGEALDATKLVSPAYLATKTKDPDGDAESWRQFFASLGVRLAPAVEAEGNDFKCSGELQLLLDSTSSSVRRATLECINLHWTKYETRLAYTFAVGRSTHGPRDTKFALSLRATRAPTKKRTSIPLAESYYPTPELRTLLGDSLPYVDAAMSQPMLDAAHVTHRLDARALVKRLKQLKLDGGTPKQVQGIYRVLDERFWDAESEFIKQAFERDRLIQVKGTHRGWFGPSEVAWRSNSTFLDSLYPPLQSQYRDFSKFFVDKLGIQKELPTLKWIDALARLGDVEDLVQRKAEALGVYLRANRDLSPRFGREVQTPAWIGTFETDAVFINQRGDVVPNSDRLFANDAQSIAVLFEDDPDLSFLAVPDLEVPRLSRLLDAACVARLSSSITVALMNSEAGIVDEHLTARVRNSLHFFARVLYAKRPDSFEQALYAGKFLKLREMDVAGVPRVEMVVALGKHSRETTTDIALSDGRVLYRTGARSVKDMLASELSKFLSASTDLADTFARILMENEPGTVEDFLEVRSIGPLPPDLLKALDSSTATDVGGEEMDVSDDEPTEQTDAVQDITTEEDAAAIEPGVEGTEFVGGWPKRAPGPTGSPSSFKNSLTTEISGEGSVDSGVPTRPESARSRPDGADLGEARTQSSGAQGSNGHPYKEPTSGRERQGQAQPPRTKAGRLLSYAAGPGEADKPNPEDDPARVAARAATERAAVEYFKATQAERWKSLTEMPHNNPGFDVHAVTEDGQEEFIEVKGQSGAWTEEGVALTPRELMTAQKEGERYWLCVVEYAHDIKRRQLHMLRNPYGLVHQFRFDVGWKSAAESTATVPFTPEKDLYIDMQRVGRGRILSVRGKGRFFNLHVILDDGRQVNKLFNPATMDLSKEPTWRG